MRAPLDRNFLKRQHWELDVRNAIAAGLPPPPPPPGLEGYIPPPPAPPPAPTAPPTPQSLQASLGRALGFPPPSPPPLAPPPRRSASPSWNEDESLAALNAEATRRAAAQDEAHGPEGLGWFNAPKNVFGAALGRVVDKLRWQRGRVWNPKILQADVKTPDRIVRPPKNWERDIVAAFRATRQTNDVKVSTFRALAAQALKLANDGRGFWQRSFAALGTLADYGKESARKFIRWCEAYGWIGTFNALYRDDDGSLKRDANIYLLFGKDDGAEIAALENEAVALEHEAAGLEHEAAAAKREAAATKREAAALKRESLTLSRGAALFGLLARPWGLNATAFPSNRHTIRRHPAPA